MKKQNNTRRIYVLDDLRGIAILFVLVFHYTTQISLDNNIYEHFIVWINNYFNVGRFAVALFFLISGFVIPMSLKGSDRVKVIKKFTIKRFFRLFPTYWFAIIFISFVILSFKDSNAYTFKQIFINFTMLQDIFKQKSIDGVFWTLMIELKFYILTALFFYFGILNNIKKIMIVFFSLGILTLVLSYTDGHRGFYNFTISYLFLMYLGTSFYSYYTNQIDKKELIGLIMLVVFYFMIHSLFAQKEGEFLQIGYTMGTVVAIFVFSIVINIKKSLSTVTTFFGNISYSLYLIHQVVGLYIIELLIVHDMPLLFAQILTFFIMTTIAFYIHRYIETTTNRLGHIYAKNLS